MNIFGTKKKRKAPAPAAHDQVQNLAKSMAALEKKEAEAEGKARAQQDLAQQRMYAKDKRGALFALKRKKMYEQEVSKIQNIRMTLEQQRMSVESMSTNVEVFNTIKSTADVVKNAHRGMNVDDIDRVMEDVNDQMDLADEVSEAVSSSFGGYGEYEGEINDELEALEAEVALDPAPARASAPAPAPAPYAAAAAAAPAPARARESREVSDLLATLAM